VTFGLFNLFGSPTLVIEPTLQFVLKNNPSWATQPCSCLLAHLPRLPAGTFIRINLGGLVF